MEKLLPILANILTSAVLDFIFGSDDSKGTGHNKGIIAKVGYPRLEKHLEYFIAKNFPDTYKIALEKQKQNRKLRKSKISKSSNKQPEKMTFYGYGYRYLSLAGQPMEEITYQTKRGTRTRRYPKPTPEWEGCL
jgi:hypothetical protein